MNEEIYVIVTPTYHEPKTVTIFTTREKAEEFKKAWDNHRFGECQIEEYQANPTKEKWGELIEYDWEGEETSWRDEDVWD